jgi:O-antigen ligase
MGFVLSLLYLLTNYLSPPTVFGPLAAFHVELILAALVLLISLPKIIRSFIIKTPQSLALMGLAFATFLSILMTGWAGGAVHATLNFIPNAFAYFLVCLHCDSKKKLQTLIAMLFMVCMFVIARGYIDLRHGVSDDTYQSGTDDGLSRGFDNSADSYLLAMRNDAGELFYRIRGQGEINDPNDFGQLIVCVIPLIFAFWRSKKSLLNIAVVILPACALLYGIYLTHSRGALLALVAVIIVAARRRIGTIAAALGGAAVFAAAMALHFTGGREISAGSGSDRTSLWSDSLQLLKSHPFFGVGFGNLQDYLGHTAHNSVAVCAAELGVVGLFFWSMFLFTTTRDAIAAASPEKVTDTELAVADSSLFPRLIEDSGTCDKAQINQLGRLLVLSLTGFLVSGWFLSRSFVVTFFLLGGMVEVVYDLALKQGMIGPRLPFRRVLGYSGCFAFLLLLLVYIMLRITNLMH